MCKDLEPNEQKDRFGNYLYNAILKTSTFIPLGCETSVKREQCNHSLPQQIGKWAPPERVSPFPQYPKGGQQDSRGILMD